MTLRDFVPPVFLEILQKLNSGNRIVEYKDYDEALQNCKTANVYESSELCQMIGEKTVNYKNFLQVKPYSIKPSNVFLVSAIYRYLQAGLSDEIWVLDFGGACGAHYFETRNLFDKRIKLNWNIVETAEMVKSAKTRHLESGELCFYDSLEKVDKKIDFVHSSGALQYVPDWSLFLEKLMQINAGQMLFNRMMFNENDRTFVTIQKSRMRDNGPGKMPEKYMDRIIEYPHTTISYKAFLQRLEKDYGLEWSFEENSGSYKINDEKITGMGLLFCKK